jgi:uncharacterized protein (TIGR03083 family)
MIGATPACSRLPYAELLEGLARISSDIAAAADGVLPAKVPTCPSWSIGDVIHHLGSVYTHVTELIHGRFESPVELRRSVGRPSPPSGELLPWYTAAAGNLVVALAGIRPDDHVWSWSPEQTASFWARRMVHESYVHLWDIENAVGRPRPIDRRLILDGIEEYLFEFVPLMRQRRARTLIEAPESFGFLALDLNRGWLVTLGRSGSSRATECAAVDMSPTDPGTLVGTAQQLLLFLWGRQQPGLVEKLSADRRRTFERWQALVGSP